MHMGTASGAEGQVTGPKIAGPPVSTPALSASTSQPPLPQPPPPQTLQEPDLRESDIHEEFDKFTDVLQKWLQDLHQLQNAPERLMREFQFSSEERSLIPWKDICPAQISKWLVVCLMGQSTTRVGCRIRAESINLFMICLRDPGTGKPPAFQQCSASKVAC